MCPVYMKDWDIVLISTRHRLGPADTCGTNHLYLSTGQQIKKNLLQGPLN